MEAYALEAVNLAQTTSQQKLDFSEDSIKTLEKILDAIHKSIPRDVLQKRIRGVAGSEIVDQVCNTYGAYIGEVMRRNIGGEWMLDDKFSPGRKIVSLRVGHLQTFPTSKVLKRILDGPGDDVWFYYRVFIKQCLEKGCNKQ